MYADVEYIRNSIESAVDADRFAELADEYSKFRNETLKNVCFDPVQISQGILNTIEPCKLMQLFVSSLLPF